MSPFAWQSNKVILLYFAQNSVSKIQFGTSVQRPNFGISNRQAGPEAAGRRHARLERSPRREPRRSPCGIEGLTPLKCWEGSAPSASTSASTEENSPAWSQLLPAALGDYPPHGLEAWPFDPTWDGSEGPPNAKASTEGGGTCHGPCTAAPSSLHPARPSSPPLPPTRVDLKGKGIPRKMYQPGNSL